MKLLSKILDNYYSNKLVQFVEMEIISKYIVDIKRFNHKNYIEIRIKRTQYNDEQYMVIFRFNKQDAFEFMCRQQELSKKVLNNAKNYLESKGE